MTLDQLKPGDVAVIDAQLNDEDALTTMRLGLIPGQLFTLQTRIPGGPVVIKQGHVELALGRDLCKRIQVSLAPSGKGSGKR